MGLPNVLPVLDRVADMAADTPAPVGEADARQLVQAADRAIGAIGRLRAMAASECDPPDLDGLCMACGRKIAEPVRLSHGCSPLSFLIVVPTLRLRRLGIRVTRLGRLAGAALGDRGSGS